MRFDALPIGSHFGFVSNAAFPCVKVSEHKAVVFGQKIGVRPNRDVVTFPAPEPRCPHCGATFTIDTNARKGVRYIPGVHVAGGELPIRMVPTIIAACNGCELVIELAKGGSRA